jgi:UDP-N-acetylmuramyl pentapeptide phosphotransferase/UDP-N-acetylglucosamine-1-phosphate transferase
MERFECWALLAALGAAFVFNRPPAKIYLGDAGALGLGFFLGALFLESLTDSAPSLAFVHLSAFVVPLFEVALLMVARGRRRLSPFQASPDHFALRLRHQGGWTSTRVLVVTGAVGAFFDLWCLLPVHRTFPPPGYLLLFGSASIAILAAAYCIRLAPSPAARIVRIPGSE